MTDDPDKRVTIRGLARDAGVPPPPRQIHGPPHVEAGEILPGSATDPERDAGLCSCGRPARIDQEVCGYCLPQPTHPPDGVRWVRGKFSDALAQTNLLNDYQRSLTDPNYISMREYGAVIDARLVELLERLQETLKSHHWTEAARTYKVMQRAFENGDTTELHKAQTRLEDLFAQGERDERTWDQIMSAMELRRKFADSEARNAERLQNMLSIQESMDLITTIVSILKQEISDHDLLVRIVNKIRALAEGDGDRYATTTIIPRENGGI